MESNLWNDSLVELPAPHILQTSEWGQVKSHFGWKPSWIVWYGTSDSITTSTWEQAPDSVPLLGMAQVLTRSVAFRGKASGLNVVYVPKGPVIRDWGDVKLRMRVLDDLSVYARQLGAVFIKIDPDVRLGDGPPLDPESRFDPLGQSVVTDLKRHGWIFSREQIQFRNTVLIQLSAPEEQILSSMKQKTRYNLRLAIRKGVKVREGNLADLGMLYRMYAETSDRDGFVIRPEEYYQLVWSTFIQAGMAKPLVAEVEGLPVAAIFIFYIQKKAWYLYGMSTDLHRERMPNYLLQWEGIRLAKSVGCLEYDLWGAPDNFNEQDPLWGVYRFKEGLGGQVVRQIGAWDLPIQPIYYKLYLQVLPRLLSIMRRRGVAQNKKGLSREF